MSNIKVSVDKSHDTVSFSDSDLRVILREYVLAQTGREVHDVRLSSDGMCSGGVKAHILLKHEEVKPVKPPKASDHCGNCGEAKHMHPYRNCDTFVVP